MTGGLTGPQRAEGMRRLHANTRLMEFRANGAVKLVENADRYGVLAVAEMDKALRLVRECLQAIEPDVERMLEHQQGLEEA